MAEILKHEYKLLVLKISLDTSKRQVFILMEIEKQIDGEYRHIDKYLITAESMDLPDKLEQRKTRYKGYNFTFPDDAMEWLQQCLTIHNTERAPLWLHLVNPYGYLGLVPWEQLIQKELDVAILRLPEFLAEPPKQNLSVLDVVLCSSMPVAKVSFMIIEHIVNIIHQIQTKVPRHTTIHVFVEGETYHQLNQMNFEFNDSVQLYDPGTSASYMTTEATSRIVDRPGQIKNPWLLWIRDSLRGTSIDVVHFLTHGYMSSDSGALALAESPLTNEDQRMARFVGAAELKTFYTHIGAWATIFSSPENNYSEMGLRQIADTIAQTRPGPVVYHQIEHDNDAEVIGSVYHFLFSPDLNVPPPSTSSVFIYCHPSRVVASPTKNNNISNEKHLAVANKNQIKYKRVQNITSSIKRDNQGLKIIRKRKVQKNRADTQITHYNMIWKNGAEDIEQVIKHYKQELEVSPGRRSRRKWAAIQNNLGVAYNMRILGDRSENIELAIKHYNKALHARTNIRFNREWAATKKNLAIAYIDRIDGNHAENIESAIKHYGEALNENTELIRSHQKQYLESEILDYMIGLMARKKREFLQVLRNTKSFSSDDTVLFNQKFLDRNSEDENSQNTVSILERFVEQKNYDLNQLAQNKDDSSLEEIQTIKSTLHNIQDIISNYSDILKEEKR